ncbi:sigma 54-interacting transcriptional regulator [Hwangdonia seohaensis]|uniref:Sigma 54-interacting transcriptional regulator n=1 Tax=Hwangdonia seohaensis TaxID=1240727 RepID=A0ABW3R7H8_9FLAO|nr:sigma 54-interacting transcriptional regulator [Hwangdonia seohaensis]
MKTILIVDDILENLYLLRVILEKADFTVVEAKDGEDALKKLHKTRVDLIISDILMPVMDGYMFCQACKKNELFKNIPFVFYTSTYTEKSDEDFALKLGADRFLRKPTDPDKILQVVQKLLALDNPPVKSKGGTQFTEKEALKLYSNRLIRKLEKKNLDLEKEIFEREKVEQKLINENHVLDLIANNTSIKKVFDHIIINYESLYPESFGSISLLHDDGIHLELISAPNTPKPYNSAIKSAAIGKNVGSCGTAAFIKKPVIVSDISTDKLWVDYKDIALKHNLKSCWSIPILSEKGMVLGTFAIYSNAIKTPSLKEIAELNSAVSLAKIAIVKFKIIAEVKKRDESYKSLINQASDAILTYSFDGTIYSFNKAAYSILGYTKKEFLKLKLQEIIVGDVIKSQNKYETLLKGKPVIFERQLICKNRTLVDAEVSAKLQTDGKVLAIIRDISERKKAETNNQRLLSLIETSNDFIGLASLEGTPIYLNSDGRKMVGIKANAELPASILDFFPEEYHDVIVNEHMPSINTKNAWHGEVLFKNFITGGLIPIQMSGFLIRDSISNKPLALGIIATDITERKKAELKLQNSEKSLIEAQKIAKIGNFNLDLKTRKIEGSAAFMEILGIDKNIEFTADIWKTLIYSEDVTANLEKFKKCIETGNSFDMEFRILTKNKKTLKWIHGLGEITFVNGEPINFFGTAQDITERKEAEMALIAAKEFTDKLVMSMQEGLLIVNLEGEIIMVNDSICEILGYSRDELIGINLPYPFAKKEDLEFMLNTKEEVAQGEARSFQLEFIKKNGNKYLVSFLSGNIKNDKGEVIALFATLKDISEEEKAKTLLEEIAKKSTQKKNVIMDLSALVGSDYHKSLLQITALSATTLNVARVGVWKFNADKTNITCEKLFNLKTAEYEDGGVLTRNDNPNYFDALADNLTVKVEDAVNNDITKGFAKNYLIPLGISSMLDVFIQGAHGMYGVICFEHIGAKRKWSADDEEFATSIASIVSLMVESSERKHAESNLISANAELSEANRELNNLREQLEQENIYLRDELALVFNYEEMVYGSEEFSNVLTEVEKVAPTNATVLLLGESGTGKELLARAIHNTGLRNKKPLIKVNCSAIPRELIESELFGHKKGSFTGAFTDKIGKFELADGGTLFLDEIGELPVDMQPKILRFLQEGEIEVVGGTDLKKLDVRVIAATNRNLKEEIEKKQFREDLYFRLNVFPIKVPPLRERKGDIPLLVEHFVDKFNKSYEKRIKYIPSEAMDNLKSYNWPGNIRELENLIERAVILSDSETLMLSPIGEFTVLKELFTGTSSLTLNEVQRNHIIKTLEKCKWKIDGENGAASLLDMKPSTLRDRMKKLGVKKPSKT